MKISAARRMLGIERTLIRQIFDAAPAGAINFGLGQPDVPTPPLVCLGGVAAIAAGRTGYTSTAGDPELRRAVAARYRPFAEGPESVLITIGSQEAMFASCLALLDPGDEVLVPDPGYPAYPVVARLVGATAIPYALRADHGFRVRAEDVEPLLTERTRLMILCAPSNPTGACHEEEELRRLCGALERRGIPWLSDEVYAGLCYADKFVSPAELAPEGGLVVSGLSKDLSMTGWRVGWVVGPPEIVARIIAVHQYVVTCSSSISQAAALAAFTPAGDAERARMLELFRRRRSVMAAELEKIAGLSFAMPQGAFYFFVDVSRFGPSLATCRRLIDRCNVVTIPGIAFGANGEGYLRLSFAATEEDIRRGVRSIARELDRS